VPSLTTLALFGLATLILTATPGPGVLYVWARSLAQGRRAGFASMFGIEAGEVVWLAAAATGLAALLAASAAALTFVRFAGAAYLIVLGIQRWRKTEALVTPERAPMGIIFAQGLITQLLNPKVAVFFVALLPQFMNTSHPIAPQVAVLGSVYIAIALLVDTSYDFATLPEGPPRAETRGPLRGRDLPGARTRCGRVRRQAGRSGLKKEGLPVAGPDHDRHRRRVVGWGRVQWGDRPSVREDGAGWCSHPHE
jgi:threonine/homoserine/homoserine lactone efflux protein